MASLMERIGTVSLIVSLGSTVLQFIMLQLRKMKKIRASFIILAVIQIIAELLVVIFFAISQKVHTVDVGQLQDDLCPKSDPDKVKRFVTALGSPRRSFITALSFAVVVEVILVCGLIWTQWNIDVMPKFHDELIALGPKILVQAVFVIAAVLLLIGTREANTGVTVEAEAVCGYIDKNKSPDIGIIALTMVLFAALVSFGMVYISKSFYTYGKDRQWNRLIHVAVFWGLAFIPSLAFGAFIIIQIVDLTRNGWGLSAGNLLVYSPSTITANVVAYGSVIDFLELAAVISTDVAYVGIGRGADDM